MAAELPQRLGPPADATAGRLVLARSCAPGGPRRLWTEVEDIYSRWTAHGKPNRSHIGITITPSGQHVWLTEPTEIVG